MFLKALMQSRTEELTVCSLDKTLEVAGQGEKSGFLARSASECSEYEFTLRDDSIRVKCFSVNPNAHVRVRLSP